ncbi:glycosyltransferase [Geopsychrobacter electrodiphilus]|uniref:glycosyltransferase n=1 Tax=Geopsychrobacter electrodiphilus TaxID=225196 RepID=UPI000360D83D|nr:glycosyltransferase [Geopsychrobacter electrodiphilus]
MSNINVLHIVNSLNVGGLEKIVIDLIGSFSCKYNSAILCLEGKGILGSDLDKIKILTLNRKQGLSLGVVFAMVKLLRQNKIDLIHTHNAAPHFYGAIAGFLLHIPVVHTKHGRNDPSARKKVLLNWFSSLLTNKIIAVSEDAKRVCLEFEHVGQSKVLTIWNGINIAKFQKGPASNNVRGEFGILPDDFLLGIVARLCPEKNHEMLLQACSHLANKGVPFKLLVVGDGPLRKDIMQQAADLKLESKICFAGLRSDIPDILNELDVFCLSSVTEGVPLTLLEALACSLPCVVTDVGGIAEVVEDGVSGFIVPSNSPVKFASKVFELFESAELRKNFSSAAQKRVSQYFSIQETAHKYEKVYESVLCRDFS